MQCCGALLIAQLEGTEAVFVAQGNAAPGKEGDYVSPARQRLIRVSLVLQGLQGGSREAIGHFPGTVPSERQRGRSVATLITALLTLVF